MNINVKNQYDGRSLLRGQKARRAKSSRLKGWAGTHEKNFLIYYQKFELRYYQWFEGKRKETWIAVRRSQPQMGDATDAAKNIIWFALRKRVCVIVVIILIIVVIVIIEITLIIVIIAILVIKQYLYLIVPGIHASNRIYGILWEFSSERCREYSRNTIQYLATPCNTIPCKIWAFWRVSRVFLEYRRHMFLYPTLL